MEVGIALGANLGDPKTTLRRAISLIRGSIGEVVRTSRIYQTRAMTPPERPEETQPDYFNAVAIAESSLVPERILEELMRHEAALGRVRGERWSARTIDLDLLFVGGAVVQTSSLRLPHPELQFRDFVLVPLVEVAPVWRHPLLGKATFELLKALQKDRKELYVREQLEPLEGEKL